jgi:hypothetical protein
MQPACEDCSGRKAGNKESFNSCLSSEPGATLDGVCWSKPDLIILQGLAEGI